MLLAVDIGNTNIKIALFRGKRIFYSWRLVTDKANGSKEYKKLFRRLFAQKKVKYVQIEAIIICSVVPKLTLVFKNMLFTSFKKRPLVLGKNIIAPIKNLYRKPQQVGQDRLANAVAAFNRYGGPVIIVDFGTALTFDLISKKGAYLGGLIVPGMETSLEALIKNADLLPGISLGPPGAPLGRDTVSSMKSGIVYGYGFLVEGVLEQLKKRVKKNSRVIATGGEAPLMQRFCPSIEKIDQNLTLEGLRISYQKNKLSKNRQNIVKIG